MKILYPSRLGTTIDTINEAFFFSQPLNATQKRVTAKWLADRVGGCGSYAGMPAPTKKDFTQGTKLFTGETLKSRASIAHILGQEACRAMILLGCDKGFVHKALTIATTGMIQRLQQEKRPGMYCCGQCSCAMWRHLAVGGLDRAEKRLTAGIKALKAHRDGTGKWKRFPFYYTLLALTEIDIRSAVTEMRYAAPVCERLLARRSTINNKYSQRRRAVAERILSMV